MIHTLTLNPAIDWELQIEHFELNSVSRAKQSRSDCGGKGFNVSRMLRNLNTDSIAMGFVGGINGQRLKSGLQQRTLPGFRVKPAPTSALLLSTMPNTLKSMNPDRWSRLVKWKR